MVGAFGAVLLRCVLTFVAVLLLGIPFIQAAGGLLLLWIAVKLLLQNDDEVHIREASTTWKAIQTILIADFVMSLDNVLAIASFGRRRFGFDRHRNRNQYPYCRMGKRVNCWFAQAISDSGIRRIRHSGFYSR